MRKLFVSILAVVVFAIGVSQFASATNRGVVYPGENPDALQSNQDKRYQRLADGTVLRDLLGVLNVTGAWSSISVVGVNLAGPYVQVIPSSSPAGQAGMLYQVLSDDPSPVPNVCPTGFPCSGYQLNADSTQIVIPALINQASSNIGPLPCNACSAGQATSYLIEAQIQTQPGNNRSMMFVSTSGAVSFPNVNTEVDDSIAYASVQGGTAAFSTASPSPGASPNPTPPMPSPAPGWVPIAYVQVYNASSNCASAGCTITMAYSSQFQAGSFGKITFGGQYASSGGTTASTLSTSQSTACGLNNALGAIINNPSAGNNAGYLNNGNHELALDQAGDIGVCGAKVYLFAQNGQNSEVPTIVSNTYVNQSSGTPSPEQLYPAAGATSFPISGTCSTGTTCSPTTSSAVEPCQYGSVGVNSIMVSGPQGGTVFFSYIFNGTPTVGLLNETGGNLTGNQAYQYVCM